MVERKQQEVFEEFKGKVSNVTLDDSKISNGVDAKGKKIFQKQYHIEIECLDKEIEGKTGLMHEWIRIPDKATDTSIPEGSVIDRYLVQIEIIMPQTAKMEGHAQVFNELKGKTFKFKKLVHGKAFDGHDAKEYWTPVVLFNE